jgi:hypothetical protein
MALSIMKFMASSVGRWIRLGMGVMFIAMGIFFSQGIAALILVVAGIPPLMSGLMNYCPTAPMIKAQEAKKAREREMAAKAQK